MCAGCSLHLSRRTYNEYRACAPRVPGVGPSLPRMSGVLLACTFMRRAPRTILCMHKKTRRTKRMVATENRCSSALDERVTNDDERRRTNHFSVRLSCVLHASTRCDRAITCRNRRNPFRRRRRRKSCIALSFPMKQRNSCSLRGTLNSSGRLLYQIKTRIPGLPENENLSC